MLLSDVERLQRCLSLDLGSLCGKTLFVGTLGPGSCPDLCGLRAGRGRAGFAFLLGSSFLEQGLQQQQMRPMASAMMPRIIPNPIKRPSVMLSLLPEMAPEDEVMADEEEKREWQENVGRLILG